MAVYPFSPNRSMSSRYYFFVPFNVYVLCAQHSTQAQNLVADSAHQNATALLKCSLFYEMTTIYAYGNGREKKLKHFIETDVISILSLEKK